jgi:hypothetical protein
VAIAAEGDAIKVTTGTKKANQPTKASRSFTTKKNARRALVTIAKEVSGYRSDLKVRTAPAACIADLLQTTRSPSGAAQRHKNDVYLDTSCRTAAASPLDGP